MCGIVGGIAQRDIVPILLEGLRRLEYRGYDSAGVAVLDKAQKLQCYRVQGKVKELQNLIDGNPLDSTFGIAHTRWATHGIPSESNAHPLVSSNEIALVHNGIIENHEGLRSELIKNGYHFNSQTDTEIIVHLVHRYYQQTSDLLDAVRLTVNDLEGAYGIGIFHQNEPGRIIAVRSGSPLVIGLGIGENFIASDSLALLPVTQQFIYLEEGDIADVRRESYNIFDKKGNPVQRKIRQVDFSFDIAKKGNHRHFMQKEIYEQSEAVGATLEGRLSEEKVLEAAFGTDAKKIFDKVQRVKIIACGTSYHAALVARYWIEEIANISCQVEIASEFRYRKSITEPNTLFVTISQSGETADTLAALRLAKEQGFLATLGICNVPESSLVRESDLVLMTRAGAEIGVASTKAFTTQLTALLLLTVILGRRHGLTSETEASIVKELKRLPRLIEKTLETDKVIENLSKQFADKEHTLFLGRGYQYPIALEGALKLKEISYIHAEAYPAGELKHGPLALVDKDMPVVAVAPNDELLEKLKSNLEEVRARGGKLIVFADHEANISNSNNIEIITLPAMAKVISPILFTIPLQLLAYHVAVLKGTDVDQPRNLAKSVTVE